MEQLVGVWSLVHYRVTTADGTVSEPFGSEPVGTGIYTGGGTVSALLMRPGRPTWGVGLSAGDPAADGALVVDAAAGFIGYSGTFLVDAETATVRHHVTCSLDPGWVGIVLERRFRFDGNELVLSTAPRAGRTAELRWERRGR